MPLPSVKIIYTNDALGGALPQEDGNAGLVGNGVAVTDGLQLDTKYLLTKLEDLEDLKITSSGTDANAHLYKAVKEFYDTAPVDSKLWLMVWADTITLTTMFDKANSYAKKLLDSANGQIRFLFAARKEPAGYSPVITDGLDNDVYTAIPKAQALGEYAADELYAPVFSLLEGRRYTGTASALADISLKDANRVGVLIGDTVNDSDNACIGLVSGLIAAIPVQRGISRVRSGAIEADPLYIADEAAEDGDPAVIHDAGFICPRTFVGKGGYFWSDDKLATAPTDDYQLIPRRRVIDKAARIAYITMVDEIGEEIPVTNSGTIPAPIVKDIQQRVEGAIITNMTAQGNLGNDPSDANDTGVQCFIDHEQNVVSTSELNVEIRVKPYGYPKYINIYLGFQAVG